MFKPERSDTTFSDVQAQAEKKVAESIISRLKGIQL